LVISARLMPSGIFRFREPLLQIGDGLEESEGLTMSLKRRRRMRVCMICVIVITLFIAGAVLNRQISSLLNSLIVGCSKLGPVAVPVVLLTTVTMNLLMLPSFPLMVGAGLTFPKLYGSVAGPALGVASVFGGMWIGSLIAFQLGRTMFKRWAEDELHKLEWMQVINKMVQDRGWFIVLLARMSPILPAEVFNYACSFTQLTLPQYAVGCIGSSLPVTIWVYSTASASSVAASSPETHVQTRRRNLAFLVVNIVVLAALSITSYCVVKQYRTRATDSTRQLANAGGRSSAGAEEPRIHRQGGDQDSMTTLL